MKKVELLSPVGNRECFDAAIRAGCDAVYLGGYLFGARSYAGNFSNPKFDSCESKITFKVLKILIFLFIFILRTFRTCGIIWL